MNRQSVLAMLVLVTLAAELCRAGIASAYAPFSWSGVRFENSPIVADSVIVCTPSRASASALDSVRVRAFAYPAEDTYEYEWTARYGRVVGQGPDVWWTLSNAPLGLDTITVRVTRNRELVGSCSARVLIVQPGRTLGASDRFARSTLLPGQAEARGYGRYSYLLFGSRPTAGSYQRYREAVTEFVRQIEHISSFADHFERGHRARTQWDLAYIPLRKPVKETDSSLEMIDSVLKYYDYARAKVLLSRLPGSHSGGPYLVSVRAPLSTQGTTRGGLLVQRLTTVPLSLVSDWVAQFLNDSAQDDFGQGWNPQRWTLRLVTALAVLAQAKEPVKGGIQEWRSTIAKTMSAAP